MNTHFIHCRATQPGIAPVITTVVFRKSVYLLAALMAGCSTSPIPRLIGQTLEAPSPASTIPARANPPVPGRVLAEALDDRTRPWRRLDAIWFSYNRSELDEDATTKLAGVVRYLSARPRAEIAINRPSAKWGIEPDAASVNPRRVDTIRAALEKAGVRSILIFEGAVAEPMSTLDRLVVISVRDAPLLARLPPRLHGEAPHARY